MALVGFELISVVIILIVLFLWGPQKLPEIAKSIGLAKKEFEKAGRELSSVTSLSTITVPTAASSTPSAGASDPLVVAANSLGISTEGKTKEEIVKEITNRTSKG